MKYILFILFPIYSIFISTILEDKFSYFKETYYDLYFQGTPSHFLY